MASEAPRLTCYRHPDRETGVSCSDCGRGLCPDCMVFAPVGIKCAEHAGRPVGVQKVTHTVKRATYEGVGSLATKTIIGIVIGAFLLQLATGGTIGNAVATSSFAHDFALYGPLIADGEWWRLLTGGVLHGFLIHLVFNVAALWWIAAPVEEQIGRGRFILVYIVSELCGSAGALLLDPREVTVGASGAIFGILGAALILERQRNYVLAGGAMTLLGINLVFTFAIPGISIGGHLGGLIGGAVAAGLMFDLRDRIRMPQLVPVLLAAFVGIAAVAGSIAVSAS